MQLIFIFGGVLHVCDQSHPRSLRSYKMGVCENNISENLLQYPLRSVSGPSSLSWLNPAEPDVWRRWHALVLQLRVGELICVRAWDSAANTQPEDPESVWNFKGYMNNSWHRVQFGMLWEDVKVAKPEVEYYL